MYIREDLIENRIRVLIGEQMQDDATAETIAERVIAELTDLGALRSVENGPTEYYWCDDKTPWSVATFHINPCPSV